MKHNARLNEKMARLPGFADIHPLQPQQTVQGALEVMSQLAHWLCWRLTGMAAVALPPAAGAHGEACGMMAIRAALEARGETVAKRGACSGARFGARHQPRDGGGAGLYDRSRTRQRQWPHGSGRLQGAAGR